MSTSFTLRLSFLNSGSYVEGTPVDHIKLGIQPPGGSFAYQNLGPNIQYVQVPQAIAGTYNITWQAYEDAAGTIPVGSGGSTTYSYNPVAGYPLALPTKLYITESEAAGYATGQILYQNLGSFTASQYVNSIVCTLSGPSSQTVTLAAGATTTTFGPGMVFGQYSYSLQAYDQNGSALGPPGNGFFWFNPTPSEPLFLPSGVAAKVFS